MASRKVVTPPINTTGIYEVISPFVIGTNTIYSCTAIRTFEELSLRGINVFNEYYKPKNIDEATYNKDVALHASIITLESNLGEIVYVPNTYIQSYPGQGGVFYVHKVLVMELGLLPINTDVSYIYPELSGIIQDNVGVTATPVAVDVPYKGYVSNEQAIDMEKVRRAAVADSQSVQAENTRLKAELAAANKQIADLTELISQLS